MRTIPTTDLETMDVLAAHQVAESYVADRSRPDDPLVRAAYRQLEAQTDIVLRSVLRQWPGGLVVRSTDAHEPYRDASELIAAVRGTGVLEVPHVEPDRRHPLLGNEAGGAYDRFRALHDLVGHVLPEHGFDRVGELLAWARQHEVHRGLARWALATELHAQHSVRWTTGELAELKATLLEPRLLRASLAGARAELSQDGAPPRRHPSTGWRSSPPANPTPGGRP
jgi:hypothetical protein